MKAFVCPNCGNDSSQKQGINFFYLEWRRHAVEGLDANGKIVVDGCSEVEDLPKTDKATVTNTPNVEHDGSHYSCKKCNWNWHDNAAKDWR